MIQAQNIPLVLVTSWLTKGQWQQCVTEVRTSVGKWSTKELKKKAAEFLNIITRLTANNKRRGFRKDWR